MSAFALLLILALQAVISLAFMGVGALIIIMALIFILFSDDEDFDVINLHKPWIAWMTGALGLLLFVLGNIGICRVLFL